MQDIIPPRRAGRGSLRSSERTIIYARQTQPRRMSSDIVMAVEETALIPDDQPISHLVRPIEHLTPDAKERVLRRALLNAQKDLKKERRKRVSLKRSITVFVVGLFVLATGYVSVDTWVTNQQVKAEVVQTTSSQTTIQTEGQDESELDPEGLSRYAVAAELPRILHIDSLQVTARILPMTVNTDNSVQAPTNIFDAGWYNGSSQPGQQGVVFIDGHASGPTRKGLFAYLDQLASGDEIRIEKGDRTSIRYRVYNVQTQNVAEVSMSQLLQQNDGPARTLILMTCAGTWVPKDNTYDQRVIVWAQQV